MLARKGLDTNPIFKARKELGLTQKQLAELAGVSPSAISKAETGADLSEQLAQKLAEYLSLNHAELMQWVASQREQSIPSQVQLSPELRKRAGELFQAAMEAFRQSNFSDAEQLMTEAQQEFEALGDKEQDARACNTLGLIAMQRGNYSAAGLHFKQTLNLWTDLSRMEMIARGYNNLGWHSRVIGEPDRATTYFRITLAIGREMQDEGIEALALFNLALVHETQGHLEAASTLLEASLSKREERLKKLEELAVEAEVNRKAELAEEMALEQGSLAEIKHNIGLVAKDRGDLETALSCYQSSLLLLRDLRRWGTISTILINMADVFSARGKHKSAAKILGAALAWREDKGIPIIPINRPRYERIINVLQAVLGEKGFNAALTEGRNMKIQEAVEYALVSSAEPETTT